MIYFKITKEKNLMRLIIEKVQHQYNLQLDRKVVKDNVSADYNFKPTLKDINKLKYKSFCE